MKSIEISGKTVEEAIEKGLKLLNVTRDQVDIEVISEGEKKMFGLLSSKPAKVKITIRENIQEERSKAMEYAKNIVENIIQKMGLTAEVTIREEEKNIFLDVKSPDSGLLIGRRGKTLEALQHILNLILNKNKEKKSKMVILNIGEYREKRKNTLINLAKKLAEKVKNTRKSITLEPMDPYDRMIIHTALKDDKKVKTVSKGEGYLRQIVISYVEA